MVNVIGKLRIDDSEVDRTKQKIDDVMRQWSEDHKTITQQMNEVGMGIQLLIRGVRLTAEATGQALDPMQNALLGLLGSTTTIILSTATAITVGSLGILTGVGLGLAAFAYGMQVGQTARILESFGALKGILDAVIGRLTAVEESGRFRAAMGGL